VLKSKRGRCQSCALLTEARSRRQNPLRTDRMPRDFFALSILDELQRRHPGRYPDRLLRSLQRRGAHRRATEGPGEDIFDHDGQITTYFPAPGVF
jgi:hypothetical protein